MSKKVTKPAQGLVDATDVKAISAGGHGKTTPTDAIAALGGIATSQINQPFGVLGLNSFGLIPSGRVNAMQDITVKGPTSVAAGKTAVYKITNYNVFTQYTVSAITGQVSIAGDTITWKAPDVGSLEDGFVINNRRLAIAVMSTSTSKTTIIYPSNRQTGLPKDFNIVTGPFAASLKGDGGEEIVLSVTTTAVGLPLGAGTLSLSPATDQITFVGKGHPGPTVRTFDGKSSDILRTQYTSSLQTYTGSTTNVTPGTTDASLFPDEVYVWNDEANKIAIAKKSQTVVEDIGTGFAVVTAVYEDVSLGVYMAFSGSVAFVPENNNPQKATKVTYRGVDILFPDAEEKTRVLDIIDRNVNVSYDNAVSLTYKARETREVGLTLRDTVRFLNLTVPLACESVEVEYEGQVYTGAKGRQLSVETNAGRSVKIRGYFAQDNATTALLIGYLTDNSVVLGVKSVSVTPQYREGSQPAGLSQLIIPENARDIRFAGAGAYGTSSTINPKYSWSGSLTYVSSTGPNSGGDI